MKLLHRIPLFWRYFLPYFILVVILVTGISVYTRSVYGQFNTKMIRDNNFNTLYRIRNQHEEYIAQMQNISDYMALSPDLYSFRFEEDPVQSILTKKLLWQYRVNSNFIYQMYLKFNIDTYLYSPTSSVTLELLLNNMLYEDISPDELRGILENPTQYIILPVQFVSGKLGTLLDTATFIFPFGYSPNGISGVLLFQIQDSIYQEMLTQEIDSQQDVFFIHDNQVIVSQENTQLSKEQMLTAYAGSVGDAAVQKVEIDGASYDLYRVDGTMLNIVYMMLTPSNLMVAALSTSLNTFWLVTLLLGLGVTLIMTPITQHNTTPIKRILTLISQGWARGNELGQIHQGISSLLERNEDLNQRLIEALPGSRAESVRRFLSNSFETEDDRRVMLEKLDVDVHAQLFAVIIIAYSNSEGRRINPQSIEDILLVNGKGAISDTIQEGNIFALLFFDDYEAFIQEMETRFQLIRDVCPQLTMATSNPHSDYTAGPTAYLEAKHAFEARFVRGNNRLLRFDAPRERPSEEHYPTEIIDRLRRSFLESDFESMAAALDSLKDYLNQMNMSLYTFRLVYNDIIRLLTEEYVRRHHRQYQEQFDYMFTLSDCLSLDEMDQILREVCQRLISKQADDRPAKNSAIDWVIHMLEQNCCDPNLSIAGLAESAGLSDAKLSVLFRNMKQITPKEYLTQLRMKKARALLRNTALSVKDIAEQVGYLDTSSFIRRFKTYIGMTPLQYRQHNTEGPEKNTKSPPNNES